MGATTNPYGTTKAFTERILTDVCKADPSLNVALLRYFNPIGAHQVRPHRRGPQRHPQQPDALHRQGGGRQAGKGACVRQRLPHPGRHRRARLHPCGGPGPAAMWRHPEAGETNCGLFICNLGTGRGYSVLEVLHAFEKACGKDPPTSSTRAAPAISLSATPTPPRPRTSWAGWHSTASRTCAPTAGTGSSQNPDGYNTAK